MPTFTNPRADAAEAQEALRGLAHASRAVEEPADMYVVLGLLSLATASLEQSLHQLAAFHDDARPRGASVEGRVREGRAASYQVAWELHRAGELARLLGEAVDRAHVVESTISYEQVDRAPAPVRRPPTREPGMSL